MPVKQIVARHMSTMAFATGARGGKLSRIGIISMRTSW
jgi:hypothetical protein